ncbi:GNAT family N-acetyltransferase [Sphingobacterium spiritivorum]|uniref:GNAT family N-acetyltransferase n=1 Tax=Sphingobacterium spiritivorum TaxID=258 RepID=UPI0019190911|nr:GNAT family N-acetyltransferase [Sphingobacterium spiritivorum]QQT25912.1 GNAT family N-acetyltransferase [Sphingobacterium spiritivorum]
MIFKVAEEADIEGIQQLIHLVKETVFIHTNLGSDEEMASLICEKGRGWICLVRGQLSGFALLDLNEKCICALFVHPEYAKNEMEIKLYRLMVSWYFERTKDKLTLHISPNSTTEKFYELQGWTYAESCNAGEVRMELNYNDWQQRTFFNRPKYSFSDKTS